MSDENELKTADAADAGSVMKEDPPEVVFELTEPVWSVVTFEKCVAKNLKYDEAFQKMLELNEQKIAGLCIVTDEAAARITSDDE